MSDKPKILVVLGPTASGKSDLAVELARTFGGEIISADSRQVYKGLNIGTGKITKKEMRGVPHHLLDVISPKHTFTAADFKERAEKAISEIIERGKLPIICGGTGFYIQTLTDNVSLPDVPPNPELRAKLKTKSAGTLFAMLTKLDPDRAKTIDMHNPVRLIRAIEIAKKLGHIPHLDIRCPSHYYTLQIGIETSDDILKQRIYDRLITRIKKGMIREAEKLHEHGLSWKRMEELGLEYRYLARYLEKKKPFDDAQGKQKMIDELAVKIWRYAKRQRTWFNRDKRIHWFNINDLKKITSRVKNFLQ